jgi:hypothetical protein
MWFRGLAVTHAYADFLPKKKANKEDKKDRKHTK